MAHEVDTSAMKLVPLCLPDQWQHRLLSGQDYGLDMAVELFGHGRPTGGLLFLQIKGTQRILSESNTFFPFDVPVRTLGYSELFVAPLVLVVCPTRATMPHFYFVWLQEYIRIVLEFDKPDWRQASKTVRIQVPTSNRVERGYYPSQLEQIAVNPSFRIALLKAARTLHNLQRRIRLAASSVASDEMVADLGLTLLEELWLHLKEMFPQDDIARIAPWNLVQHAAFKTALALGKVEYAEENVRRAGWSSPKNKFDDERLSFVERESYLQFVRAMLEPVDEAMSMLTGVEYRRWLWEQNRIHSF